MYGSNEAMQVAQPKSPVATQLKIQERSPIKYEASPDLERADEPVLV